ncbi:hypothetical protein FBU30_003991 [Linnemannia zychae]|nr:hypothetical protein FBU30_003991 [Linnemannia zychae]
MTSLGGVALKQRHPSSLRDDTSLAASHDSDILSHPLSSNPNNKHLHQHHILSINGKKPKPSRDSIQYPRSIFGACALYFGFLIALAFLAFQLHYSLPAPVSSADGVLTVDVLTGQKQFSEENVRRVVKHLSEDIGYRIVGTEQDQETQQYLLNEIHTLQLHAKKEEIRHSSRATLDSQSATPASFPKFEVWVQKDDGAHQFDFMSKVFNGGEESLQDASHSFINNHPLRKHVRTVINLEGCGTTGPEILFQANSQPMIEAYSKVPYPHATVLANDFFTTGVLLSDTDYRIFVQENLTGIDMAVYKNSYLYHTHLDLDRNMERGLPQHLGENALALTTYIGDNVDLTQLEQTSSVVFFDVLGQFFVFFSLDTAIRLHIGIGLLAVFAIVIGACRPTARSTLSVLFSLVAALLTPNLAALVLQSLGRPMIWFSHEWFPIVMFGPLAAAGMLGVQWLFHNRKVSNSENELSTLSGITVLYTFLMAVTSIARVASSYFLALYSVLTSIALLFNYWKYRSRRDVISTVDYLTYFVASGIQTLYGAYLGFSLFDLIVPLTGRIGVTAPVDNVMAIVTGFGVFFINPPILAFSHRFGMSVLKKVIVGLILLQIVVLLVGLAVLTPYDTMHPKRVFVQHLRNITSGESLLYVAHADPGPFYNTYVSKLEDMYETKAIFRSGNDNSGDWNSIYPFSQFLDSYVLDTTPYIRRHTSNGTLAHSSEPLTNLIHNPPKLIAENVSYNPKTGLRKLTVLCTHPDYIWTVTSFDAEIVSWSMDVDVPSKDRFHYVIRNAGGYRDEGWRLDIEYRATGPEDRLHIELTAMETEGFGRDVERELQGSGDIGVMRKLVKARPDFISLTYFSCVLSHFDLLVMKSLLIPRNESTQRLEQAFQLVLNTTPQEYTQQCKKFISLGGLPRSWIIKGESGTGKTYLANVLCKKYVVDRVVTVTIGDLAVMYPGDLLKGLVTYFKSIRQFSKAVVIFDNIELIFPRDDSNFALVHAFKSWIQGFKHQDALLSNSSSPETSQHRVLILGLTQDARALDPSITTLFDDSIELDIPTPEERTIILKASVENHQMDPSPPNSSSILEIVASKCHGYLPADLDALCSQAALIAHEHGRAMNNYTLQDFYDGMKAIRVSALRQNMSVQKVDPVHWTDIGGLENVKKTLEESVIWLYKHAEAYARMGISPSKGVLLYGPPGTGKTLLAKAVATESEANFMAVSIPELIKGEVGESEKAIAKVFRTASKCSPCIVFLDELEAIFGARESSGGLGKQLISQLLLEMDSCRSGVVILAATNHPEAIDSSILRPGRLDRLVYVPPPTLEERVAILKILKSTTRISDATDLQTIGNLTNNFTGADMKALVRKAGLCALKENRSQIEFQDFFAATADVQPSVNQFGLLRYEQFRRK